MLISGSKKFGGHGQTLILEVVSFQGTPEWEDFCQDVSSLWMKLPGARLHWGKYWPSIDNLNGFIRNVSIKNLTK